eukprot:Hpha_TRINITY_DN16006_c1_g7::TRINITY_DN16006_c1_g7_i1::g.122012::m.122012
MTRGTGCIHMAAFSCSRLAVQKYLAMVTRVSELERRSGKMVQPRMVPSPSGLYPSNAGHLLPNSPVRGSRNFTTASSDKTAGPVSARSGGRRARGTLGPPVTNSTSLTIGCFLEPTIGPTLYSTTSPSTGLATCTLAYLAGAGPPLSRKAIASFLLGVHRLIAPVPARKGWLLSFTSPIDPAAPVLACTASAMALTSTGENWSNRCSAPVDGGGGGGLCLCLCERVYSSRRGIPSVSVEDQARPTTTPTPNTSAARPVASIAFLSDRTGRRRPSRGWSSASMSICSTRSPEPGSGAERDRPPVRPADAIFGPRPPFPRPFE